MIDVSNLSYQYGDGKVLKFPDLKLAEGQHTLILGESGSGKTTMLHLLGGLLKSQQGSIKLEGTELSTLTHRELDRFRGKYIGFIFQKNHLISALTVKKNLLLSPFLAGLPQNSLRAEEILSQLGLSDKMNSKVTELSQGQQQRVAIARSVVNNPHVILADEPTSALDDKNCEKVMQLLFETVNKNKATLIVATHDQRIKNMISNQVILNGKNNHAL